MKIAGIVLLVLQVLGLVRGITSGQLMAALSSGSPAFLLGLFLPGIIGVVLLVKAKKKGQQ